MTFVQQVQTAASHYAGSMEHFLRDLIRIPGEGQHEEAVVKRIYQEMERLTFNRIQIDDMGNILGSMGNGDKIVAFDGHIDTVGPVGNWTFDPYEGFSDDIWIGGRGSSDQLGGIVSAVYGARIAKDLNLIPESC